MADPTPYDRPVGLLERFMFPSLRNAYLEGAAADREPGYNVAGMLTHMHNLGKDLTKAQKVIDDAPHGPHCSSLIAVPDPPRYVCNCWKAPI